MVLMVLVLVRSEHWFLENELVGRGQELGLQSTVAHKCNGKTKSHCKTKFSSRYNKINLQSNETSRQNKINSRKNNINSRQNTINLGQNNIDLLQNTINSRQNKISSRKNTINSLQNKQKQLLTRANTHPVCFNVLLTLSFQNLINFLKLQTG